jgi:hypothetical protein
MVFNGKHGCFDSRFGSSFSLLRIPLTGFLEILHDGSVFFAKPRSEERESGTGETFVGDHQEFDLDAMGSLLLRVSRVVGCGGWV